MKNTPKLITIALVALLASCTPTAYVVDTTPYTEQILASPSEVVVKPEHVESVGGFSFEGGISAETENGRITVSESGVRGEILIDLRDAPRSYSDGGK